MKYVKLNFKDILFYAPKWSDAKGASYGHFIDFSSPTFEAGKKIKVSSNPLNQKNMHTMAGILVKFILQKCPGLTHSTLVQYHKKDNG